MDSKSESLEKLDERSLPPTPATTSDLEQGTTYQQELSPGNLSVYDTTGILPCQPTIYKNLSQPTEEPNNDQVIVIGWDGEEDPENPQNFGQARKWVIVIVLALSSTSVTCDSSLYSTTYAQITVDFHVSELVATLGLSLFLLGMGIAPLFLGPLSEHFGRRPIYIGSLFFSLIWLLMCALSHNITTMLIGRFLGGLAGSAFLSVAGGTVGDMFHKVDLQAPMMIYSATQFMGPELGPLLGGFINEYTSWRWSFWFLLIWTALNFLFTTLLVPETYHPVLLRRRSAHLRATTNNPHLRAPNEPHTPTPLSTQLTHSLLRPFQLLILEPMCLNLCLYSALLLGTIYLFFGAFAQVFGTVYHFTLPQIGLTFLGLVGGILAGVATDPLWHRVYLRLSREREQAGGEPGGTEPEFRLPQAIAGSVLVPIGVFAFAWTAVPGVHWLVPIVLSSFFGAGVFLAFTGVFTFLVDAYPLYAASALAANSFVRSSFGAVFPLFGVQMYNKLGFQWASSLLGFLTLAMMPFPYIFFRYGKRIRAKSRFAARTGDGN